MNFFSFLCIDMHFRSCYNPQHKDELSFAFNNNHSCSLINFYERRGNIMERIILHCVINNCYTSIECAENPELKGKPVIVCDSTDDPHCIVLAKSPEAKKYGIQTGETLWQAKMKNPDLITVNPQFNVYTRYSQAIRNIYYRFTDKIESSGLNECWLDITNSIKSFGSVPYLATLIKNTVRKEMGVTISIGVSFNKVFSKIASGLTKDNSIKYIDRKNYKKEIWNLSINKLPGVKGETLRKLNKMHIKSIGDIANETKITLEKFLGKKGALLWEYANGLDNSIVSDCDVSTPVKSVGHGITIQKDMNNNDDVWQLIFALSDTVGKKLESNRIAASKVQITIRDCQQTNHEFQCVLATPTQNPASLSRQIFSHFTKNYTWNNNIRSISIRAIELVPYAAPYQFNTCGNIEKDKKSTNKESLLDKLQNRFGAKLINYGILLYDSSHYSFDKAQAKCV